MKHQKRTPVARAVGILYGHTRLYPMGTRLPLTDREARIVRQRIERGCVFTLETLRRTQRDFPIDRP